MTLHTPLIQYRKRVLGPPVRILRRYWRAYGGTKALLGSVYLHLAILFTLLLCPVWLSTAVRWYELVIAVVPSLIGFGLAGYALLLSFGDDEFRRAIAGSETVNKPSPFMKLNASFVHFILCNLSSLFVALLGKSLNVLTWRFQSLPGLRLAWLGIERGIGCIGFLFFVYSLLGGVALTFAVFRIGTYVDYQAEMKKRGQ